MKSSREKAAGCKRQVEAKVAKQRVPSQRSYNFFEIARQRSKAESEGLPPWHAQLTTEPLASTPKKICLPEEAEGDDLPKSHGSAISSFGKLKGGDKKERKKVQLVRLVDVKKKRRVCKKSTTIAKASVKDVSHSVAVDCQLSVSESSQSDSGLLPSGAAFDSSWSDDIFNVTFDYSLDEACAASPGDDDGEALPVGVTWEVDGNNFGPGDLIWVRYKKFPFWPALVLNRQKISKVDFISYLFIEYTDDGQLKYIRPERKRYNKKAMFAISCDYAKMKADGLASSMATSFATSMAKVEAYIFKSLPTNAKDKICAASRFFGLAVVPHKAACGRVWCKTQETGKQFLFFYWGRSTGETCTRVSWYMFIYEARSGNTSTDGDESGSASGSQPTCASLTSSQTSKNSLDADEEVPSGATAPTYSEEALQKIAERDSHLDSLVTFIATEKCKKHLCNVHEGKVMSCFKSDFLLKKTAKRQIQQMYLGYGPFSNSQVHLEKVIDLIERHVFNSNGECVDEVGSSQRLMYVLRALAPEAIVFALQNVNKLSRAKAEDSFHEGVTWTMDELESSAAFK